MRNSGISVIGGDTNALKILFDGVELGYLGVTINGKRVEGIVDSLQIEMGEGTGRILRKELAEKFANMEP